MNFIKSYKDLKKNIKNWDVLLKNNPDYIPTIGNMFYNLHVNNRFITELKNHKISHLEKDRELILNTINDMVEEMYAKFWDRAINSKKQVNFNLISQYSRVYQGANDAQQASNADINIKIITEDQNRVDLKTINNKHSSIDEELKVS